MFNDNQTRMLLGRKQSGEKKTLAQKMDINNDDDSNNNNNNKTETKIK